MNLNLYEYELYRQREQLRRDTEKQDHNAFIKQIIREFRTNKRRK